MKFNYSNVLSELIGKNGLSVKEIKNSKMFLEEIKENIKKKIDTDYYALKLPSLMWHETNKIKETARIVQDNFENFVVVGMGGSSLGNELLHFAINGIYYNESSIYKTPHMYFMDNVDPVSVKTLLDSLDLNKTVFNVITKSGSTAETMQNLLCITDVLNKHHLLFNKHLIFTTDPEKGFLKKLAEEFSIKTFTIPPLVGGRYSVLSNVGLLSAAVEGIDIDALLGGATNQLEEIKKKDVLENASILLPFIQYKLFKEKKVNINALFTYSDGLSYLGIWYRQLLAESCGKRFTRDKKEIFTGITPLAVKGTTDQHSILQLFIEGPFDKLIIFIAPEQYKDDFNIDGNLTDDEHINYLKHKNTSQLIRSEFFATQAALNKSKKPFISIEIPEINETTLGELIYFFEYEVVALGEMLNIDPINQPAVELGKQYTYGIMGREGFGKKKDEFAEFIEANKKYVIEAQE